MKDNSRRQLITENIADSLDVPISAYEAAERRYQDLSNWLGDPTKAQSAAFHPHVFPQGSFRLGTVTRPWKREDYDLDLSCTLQDGVTKMTHTQEELKMLIGNDLNKYRSERGIQERLEEKHRCWRLHYQEQLKFHMDTVPAIPEEPDMRRIIRDRMIKAGSEEILSQNVADLAVAITDNSCLPEYIVRSPKWPISNPEGYAKWFESRMRQAQRLLEARAAMDRVSKIDDLPSYRWKTPLQRCIQILKRHRDIRFENDPDGKPISIIITTLAALSYRGESDIESAMISILANMGNLVNPTVPRVPNPVNPVEDFADKWSKNPNLESNFWQWIEQVRADFDTLAAIDDTEVLAASAMKRFGTSVNAEKLRSQSSLFNKASLISSGVAYTASDGTIGSTGMKNKSHKFYA